MNQTPRTFVPSAPRHPGRALLALALAAALLNGLASADESDDYESLWERGAYREALQILEDRVQSRGIFAPADLLRDRAELRFLVGEVDGAIQDYELIAGRMPSALECLRLAEFLRYRGRIDDHEKALQDAEQRLQEPWNRSNPEEALLAAGRLAELRGEDPKRILSTVYAVLMERAPNYAPGFVAAGNLAYAKGSFASAAQYFEKALDAASENQEALAGLAACYRESRDERFDALLKKLEDLNPHHPGGAALRVEMLLDAGKAQEALERIQAALAVNPNQLRFRALKAAALFLADDEAAMEAVQRDALRFNPLCSEVYRVPGTVAARHYRFQEAEALQRKALDVDPQDHAARAELGINLLRLGRDEDGRRELEAAFEADPYNVRVFNSLKVLDTLATFETVSRGPFEVQLPRGEASVLAPAALSLLDEALASLREKYQVDVQAPVRVQIFDDHDDFMVRSLGLPGNPGHLGICFGRLITMDSPSARPKGSTDWHAVLWHEFAHVITLQKTHNRMPRWLSEGISVHEETLRNPGWGMRADPGHADLLKDAPLPAASDLELFFTQPKTPRHLMLGYFLAGEFVTWYVKTHGEPALVDALGRIGNREPALEALAAAAGIPLPEMDEEFRAHLSSRLSVLENLPAFAEAMKRGSDASARQSWAEAEQAFEESRRLFPEYAGPDGPLARLAAVYEATGQVDRLEQALRAHLALNSASLPAWRRLAALYKESANWDGVLYAAAGAAAVDPFDADLARALFEAQCARGDRENALATAERLTTLDAPRAAEYQLARARLLIDLERWAEAERQLVLLLEERPHYWEAQELLLALDERDKT